MLCDKGHEPGAKTYTITDGETTWEVELCDSHAAPLLKLAELGRTRTASPRRPTQAAKTMEPLIRKRSQA